MPVRVVDASALGALAFGEPRGAEALASLQGAELFAPTLLPYELASIARRKSLDRPELREALMEALGVALAMDIGFAEVPHPSVVALALQTGLTTYDASYLHLAQALGADLVTFDERLRRAWRPTF